MVSPCAVLVSDPPAPGVVVRAPNLILCPAPWDIVQDVDPSRVIATTSPTADAAGRENDKAAPAVHMKALFATSGVEAPLVVQDRPPPHAPMVIVPAPDVTAIPGPGVIPAS